ncbi:hypothetical protein SRHO_G00329890 [Serrasalmus rhombeus]
MSNNKEWYQLDQDLDKMLEATLVGTAEQKVNTLTTITYNLAREHFGVEVKKVNIKTLLGEAKSGRLTSPKEDAQAFLRETHNDTHRNQTLDANPSINSTKILEKELNISEPSWKEVQEVVKKARTGSAQAVYPTMYIRLPNAPSEALETDLEDLEKGYYSIMLEESRGLFRAKGRELLNH